MLKTELQAHSRMLSAMAVHPTRPLFATAAEDATMAVWQMLDADQEVCQLLSRLGSSLCFFSASGDILPTEHKSAAAL